jgi:hypothetical protein
MQRIPPLPALLGLAILAFCFSACNLNERVHNMGPDVNADLIVYFKADTTGEHIRDFWENVLKYPNPKGGGQFLSPGVGRLSRVESVEGHEGIASIFFWDAEDAERAQLRRSIEASPMVFTVLENIAPKDVKTLKR